MITNNSLGNQYNVQGLDRAVLSRTISDAATIQQPLFPWGLPGCSYTNALEFLFHNSPDTIFMEWPLRFLACFVR